MTEVSSNQTSDPRASSVEPLCPIPGKGERPYFINRGWQPQYGYVGWIDVLGAKSAMQRSVMIAANFVMKIHVASLNCLQANTQLDIALFPMNDGVFLVSEDCKHVKVFLRGVMRSLSATILHEKLPKHRFLARGAVAFGQYVTGGNLVAGARIRRVGGDGGSGDQPSDNEARILQSVLVGQAVVAAFESERFAPPFGVYIHETARSPETSAAKSRHVWSDVLWPWWGANTLLRDAVGDAILGHLDWCKANPTTAMLTAEAESRLRSLTREYFER